MRDVLFPCFCVFLLGMGVVGRTIMLHLDSGQRSMHWAAFAFVANIPCVSTEDFCSCIQTLTKQCRG